MPNRILASALLVSVLGLAGTGLAAEKCPMEIQAHRGARPFSENGLRAIEAAARQGYDAAEIDIQPLKSGWAVHHDAVLGRVVSGPPPLPLVTTAEFTPREWKSFRLRSSPDAPDEAPATFDEAIDTANAASIRLAVEIKAPVDCAAVDDALKRAERLKIRPTWHTAFEKPARCLAARNVADLGFVIGPDPDRMIGGLKDAKTRTTAASLLSLVRKSAPDADAELTNRKFLTLEGLDRIAGILGNVPRKRLILPSTDVATLAWLPQAAARRGLGLVLYAENGADDVTLRDMRKAKIQPMAVVADGPRGPFCGGK